MSVLTFIEDEIITSLTVLGDAATSEVVLDEGPKHERCC